MNTGRKAAIPVALILAILVSGCVQQAPVSFSGDNKSRIIGEVADTDLKLSGNIMIEGVGEFQFQPEEIATMRKDIFTDGHFSVFDVLAHLDSVGSIDMAYHLDEEMNTNVIDSINGMENWWYMAYYDGGWAETNVFRADHYPYKDRMYIRFYQTKKEAIDSIYQAYREEGSRKAESGGKVIISSVLIKGLTVDLKFYDVEVTAHDLRSDSFQPGVITAIDVVMSLADQGKLSYDLKWYDSIGASGIVRSYWVERIDEDESFARCGFVYESGPVKYIGFRGNHIHIPSDSRVINSPEYLEMFWICL